MKKAAGFTLLEIMVATFVVGMVISLIHMTYFNTVSSKQRVEAGNEMYHSLRWALDKITSDLASAFVASGGKNQSLFLGLTHDNRDGIPQDELHFTNFGHIKYNPTEKSCDQAEVSYFVMENPEEEEESYILFRREDYLIDEDLTEGGEILELVEGIVAFSLRFYDGENWVDQWDSRNFAEMEGEIVETTVEQSDEMIGSIPAAVEIILSMRDPNTGQEIYITTKTKLVLSAIDLSSDDYDDEEEETSSSKKSSGSSSSSGSTGSGSTGSGGLTAN